VELDTGVLNSGLCFGTGLVWRLTRIDRFLLDYHINEALPSAAERTHPVDHQKLLGSNLGSSLLTTFANLADIVLPALRNDWIVWPASFVSAGLRRDGVERDEPLRQNAT
jgi:hypothetical protein